MDYVDATMEALEEYAKRAQKDWLQQLETLILIEIYLEQTEKRRTIKKQK